MADGFHDLVNIDEVGEEQLKIPRTKELLAAIQRHRDYTLINLFSHVKLGSPKLEILVADVECDGVPSRCEVGIEYRERVAICVSEDIKDVPEVLAL